MLAFGQRFHQAVIFCGAVVASRCPFSSTPLAQQGLFSPGLHAKTGTPLLACPNALRSMAERVGAVRSLRASCPGWGSRIVTTLWGCDAILVLPRGEDVTPGLLLVTRLA